MHNHDTPNPEALGQSDAFISFQEQISDVAPIDRPVLILGERGTGKELAASRLHYLSRRWKKPFVTLNCSALTPTLIGSELFGYEKGAFTGASSRRAGRFEQASGGTLFLDEIGTIPMEVQEKILRVVEYGSFERVGSSVPVKVDVRIVAATNADLAQMVHNGDFKQDLLDRLSFEVIYVPPLRHRKGDIELLANYFASRMAFELGHEQIPEFADKAMEELETYSWPGNVRELKNVIERAVYKSRSGMIDGIMFDPFVSPYGDVTAPALDQTRGEPQQQDSSFFPFAVDQLKGLPFKQAVAGLESFLIEQALEECRYNQKKSARKLGLTYDQFRGLKRKYKI